MPSQERRRWSSLVVGLTAIALLVLLPAQASATATIQVVYPTGQFPTDQENVQRAIDGGGTVVLKSVAANGVPTAFNFGPANSLIGGRVYLTANVVVLGERAGSHMTTIRGGYAPFFGKVPVSTHIEGINFEGPLLSAVIITHSTGTEFVGNRIADVVESDLPSVSGVTPYTEGRGIKFLGNREPSTAITGRVLVADNVIENLHADLSDAIVFDAVAADLVVTRNQLGTTQSSGVYVIESRGSVEITDNDIVPGPGDPGEFSFGNGITIVGSRGATFRIAENRVVCENSAADGIYLAGGGTFGEVTGTQIHDNRITMRDSAFAAIALEDAVSTSSIARNTIVGAANHAFELRRVRSEAVATSNDVRDNEIGQLDARAGAVFLDRHTRGTTVQGSPGWSTNMGDGNVINDLAPFPLTAAQAPHAARVVVPAPGAGTTVEGVSAAAEELKIEGPESGPDNARVEIVATPATPGDLDLELQRRRPDGRWLTVGAAMNSDIDGEYLSVRRQPSGTYRVLVRNFLGGPQLVNLTVTFFNQADVAGVPAVPLATLGDRGAGRFRVR